MIDYYSMNGCEDEQSFRLRLEAVQYFKSLITYRQSEGKPTRLVNFAGHVGRHMRKEVRVWFVNQYPNTSDYANFFFEHESEFGYDPSSGEVKLNDGTKTFHKPSYLTKLEVKARDKSELSLYELSSIMLEFECFHASFTLLKDNVSQNEYSITITELREIIEQIECDGLALKAIDRLLESESLTVKRDGLAHYLIEYYPTVFASEDRSVNISLTPATIQHLMKTSKKIDDTIYVILRPLLVKYLVRNGSKDVDELQKALSMRHNYIVNYLFGNSDDYSLFDFVLSYSDDFAYRRVTNDDGSVSRMIIAKSSGELNRFDTCNHNDDSVNERDDSPQHIMPDLLTNTNVNVLNSLLKKAHTFPEQLAEASNSVEQNGSKNHCCVCEMDDNSQLSSKLMNYSTFKQFVMTHTLCFMRRLVVDLRIEAEKRHKQLNYVTKATQTVSTGAVFSP